jgi:hypothetical protein
MKRLLTLLLALGLLASIVTAQSVTPMSLVPKDARSIAMGGAFTALGSGYQSLYGNPAGFGVGRGMLTLANASFWGFVKPTSQNLNELGAMTTGDSAAIVGKVSDLLTGNGIGAGGAAGLGFTGGGLGLGVTAVSEEYARGATLLGTSFTSATQINAIAGLAITLGPKEFNVKIGGDLRPFVRVEGNFPAMTLVSAIAGSSANSDPLKVIFDQKASYGVGLAADLGAIATIGDLSAGLSIRDIAPPFNFTPTTFGIVTGATPGSINANPSTDPKGQFFPNVTLGLGWSPKFIPGIIDPSLYLEVQDFKSLADKNSIWNLLHAGGELRLLSFIFLRGGINQGWLTAGAGVNLLILQVDVAAFTEELGMHPGDMSRAGVAANIRLHL